MGSRRDLSWNPGLSMHFQDAGLEPRVEYSVLCLYSECTFGAHRGVRKVHTEYTSCAEYNVKYVEYIQSKSGST